MKNSTNTTKKKKVPLFPTFKTSNTLKTLKGHPMLSDSSDGSDIDNLSDCEINENNIIYSRMNKKINNKDLKLNGLLDLNKSKSEMNSYIAPRPTIDAFKDIEEYVAKSAFDKNKINNNNENKNPKDEGKIQDINFIKKNSAKIINDFYINNEGDIELTNNTQKDGKNKQNNEENNNIILGPLMEEYENFNSIFINQNKSIFSSIKELWDYQKILLENQIFDMKSKK